MTHYEQQEQRPTTGPLRPLIVVMESTDDDEQEEQDPSPTVPHPDDEEEQDVLPPPSIPQSSTPSTKGADEQESAPPPPREPKPLALPMAGQRPRPSRALFILASLGMSLTLLAIAVGVLLWLDPAGMQPLFGWLPAMAPTASVTLTPVQHSLHTSVSLTAVTGTPDPSRQQVHARLLSVSSQTIRRTIPTSGHGHTQAAQAYGTLTFYNAAPYVQTVAAGTVLTGADGVALVTNEAAFLPAANLPAVGMATVSAQAVQVGPQGNILPLDLNGLCCVAGISVKNTQSFSGGQAARDYPLVTREDVENVATPQRSLLTQQAQADLQTDVHQGEQLAGPAQCRPTLATDHPIGSEASSVTISLHVTCQGEVYDQQAVEQLATTALSEQARATLGAGYSVQGSIRTTIVQVATTEQAHGTLSLLVEAQGTWSYQFSSVQVSQLAKRIAGLSRSQAVRLLKEDPHLQAVTITETWNATTLPTDPSHIQMMVLGVVNG